MSQRRTVPRNSPGHSPGLVDLFSLWKCSSPSKAQCRQWLACFSGTLTMSLVGTVYGWTNISFHLLTSGKGDAPLTLTHDEYSWSVSLTVLSSMIGSLLAAQLADRIGRKYCLVACSIMFTLGWLHMYSSTSVRMLYFARGIFGIGVGIARTINPMFVSEVADIKLRGRLGTLITANLYFGSLLTYAFGLLLTYTSHLLLLAGISAISILPLMCLRETPYFLVAKGKNEQASKSIAYYKDIEDPDQVKVELRALRAEARYGLHQQSRRDLPPPDSINLPLPSSSDLPPPCSTNFPPPSSGDLPPPCSTNFPPPSSGDLPPPCSTNFPPPSSGDLPPPCSTNFPPPSSDDLPPRYSAIFPSASCGDLPPSYCAIFPPPSSRDLPPPYPGNLPSQSIRETHSDPRREVVGIQATSDLDLPSSSDSHSQSISSVHSKFKCEVRTQTTGELRVEYSRVSPGSPLQTSRELHSQSASDLHRPSTSQIHRPPTSQIHPDLTFEMHRPSISEIHQPSTSEMHPETTSEIHPAITSEIHPEATSEIYPETTSEIHLEATSEIHPETTREIHPEAISEIHPETISEIHPETISEIHSETTREIHPEAISEIHPETTSEIHLEATSEIHPETTSEIHPEAISEIHPEAISEIHPETISEIHPEIISEIHAETIREIHPEITSEIHPEATSEIHPEATNEIHPEATSEIHPEITSEIHPEATSEIHTETTSEIHLEATSEIHPEITSEIHPEATSEIHPEAISEIHPETISEIHSETISEIHPEITSEIHPETTSQIHQPSTSHIHRPSTSQILPETRSELHSRARSHLQTQSSQDSQDSTDISEPYMDLTKYTCLDKLRAIRQRSNRRALIIMLGLIMSHLGGSFTATQYQEVVSSRINVTSNDRYYAFIFIEVLRLSSGHLTSLIVDLCGRKIFFFMSTVGACYISFLLSRYLYSHKRNSDNSITSASPVFHFFVHQVVFPIGLGTLPNVFLCDLFPTKLKGFVGAIVVIFDGIIGLTASKLHQVITDDTEQFVYYTFFPIISLVVLAMVLIRVPETGGKTYNEIEERLGVENVNSSYEEVSTDEMDSSRI